MADQTELDELITAVMANKKYQAMTPILVERLCQSALDKGLQTKAAVKEVRNKLHQVANAYFTHPLDYKQISARLNHLPGSITNNEVKDYCRKLMELHTSTSERLPILPEFFHTCLKPIAPVTSILDLACGLNPLAIPWMPLAASFTYHCCDIYKDMIHFMQTFFNHFHIQGSASTCDLAGAVSLEKNQVSLLLKSIPCLEQLGKGTASRILDSIPSQHILVSFPVHSLGGRNKGMPEFYKDQLLKMATDRPWQVREYRFSTELAFLISK